MLSSIWSHIEWNTNVVCVFRACPNYWIAAQYSTRCATSFACHFKSKQIEWLTFNCCSNEDESWLNRRNDFAGLLWIFRFRSTCAYFCSFSMNTGNMLRIAFVSLSLLLLCSNGSLWMRFSVLLMNGLSDSLVTFVLVDVFLSLPSIFDANQFD